VVVIGGGITGLACALRLETLASDGGDPCNVTILEASNATGGKLHTEHVGDFIVDTGPDIFLANKPHGVALCSALGIIEQMQPTNPDNRTTYVRRDGALHPETLYADLPLITPRTGMQTLVDAARARLGATRVLTSTRAQAIVRTANGYRIATDNTNIDIDADAVVIAIPAPSAAPILTMLDPTVASLLARVPYTAMTTVSAAYHESDIPRPLNGYGYVVAGAPHGAVTACTWTSAKIPGRAPAGYALLRGYVRGDDAATAESLVLAEIRDGLGVTAAPVFVTSRHWTDAVPLYDTLHATRVTTIRELLGAFPGIAIAGGALDGAGIPDSIGSANAAADTVWATVVRPTPQIT
jgi:protoporphyrinogen oxidase